MVASQTPTLIKIKTQLSLTDVRALVTLAVCEVCDFFNVGKNMSDTQIATTVDLIIDEYYYLHLEEIKYCFRRAMRREKLYDRLDGNIILSWLEAYRVERDEAAEQDSAQRELQEANAPNSDPNALAWEEYAAELLLRAEGGDKVAVAIAENVAAFKTCGQYSTREDVRQKELDYKKFYLQYLRDKYNNKSQ